MCPIPKGIDLMVCEWACLKGKQIIALPEIRAHFIDNLLSGVSGFREEYQI